MTLDKLLSKARALEASESQASGMEHSSQPSIYHHRECTSHSSKMTVH